MSLATPTTAEITANIVAQIEAAIGQSVPLLPKAFIRVLARVLSGVFIILYKYAGFIFLQSFVRTASFSPTTINGRTITPLVEWGRLVGVGDPTPATAAEFRVRATVTTQGGTLPAGTQLLNSDNGITYVTVAAVLLNSSTVLLPVRATADQTGGSGAGTQGNLPVGASLSFANPPEGVQRVAPVELLDVTGADAESADNYRQRVIDRFQKRPQGGALADYELWAEEVPGVANAYPHTGDPGEVDVYVEVNDQPDGIPTSAQLQAVFDSINQADRRPANAYVNVRPIIRTEFSITVDGFQSDSIAAAQAEVEAAVSAYLESREPFIEGLSIPPRRDQVSQTAVAALVESVASSYAGTYLSVVLDREGVGSPLYYLTAGEKAKLGGITWA